MFKHEYIDITRGKDGSKKLIKIYQIVGRLRGDC